MPRRVTMSMLVLLGVLALGARAHAAWSQPPAAGRQGAPAPPLESTVPHVADSSEIPALEHDASAPELGSVLPRCGECREPAWPAGAPALRFRLYVVVQQDGSVGTARIVQVLQGDPDARPVGTDGYVAPPLRDSPTARAGHALLAAARQWRFSKPSGGLLLIVTDRGNDSPAAAAASVAALRAGTDVPAPKKLVDVRPVYPPDAIKARISGEVVIEATISPTGDVEFARVVTGMPMLDEAALEAVRQWKYTPTLRNGQAVSVTLVTTVTFALGPPRR
jgi:protein TonB